MAISVASTVVLTRVLSDNKALHTTTGHVALGWLVVEDLFTILLLVLLPAIVGGNEQSESVWHVLAVTTLKLGALVVFALVVGQRIIPKLLAYVARTGTRDLFTLSVLVLALGVGFLVYLSFNFALKHLEAGIVALFGNLIPVFTLIFAFTILGERLTLAQTLGVGLTFLGVIIAALPEKQRQ